MTIYSVYVIEAPDKDTGHDYRFVPDTKSIWALIAPPVWLIWHRLWLALLVYFCVATGIGMLAGLEPGPAAAYLSILPGLFLLLDGNQLIVNKLERDGWVYQGVVEANSKEDAETKFFMGAGEHYINETRVEPVGIPTKTVTPVHSFSGLFPE